MIRLFNKDETNFDSNGLGVLDPAIKENVVEEKMNGIYNFDFAYLSSGKHASQLEGDMIIKAPTPDGDQLFRVYKVTKNIGYLEVNCYHIFYDLAGNFIEDINIVSQSGQAAITHFGAGLQYATRFKFVSNIVRTNSARMVRLNAVQALLDSSQDNSFLSRWGGEIKRDNFTVYMNDVRGNDKGFKIRHGKNLTGYEANIDHSSVVTRIMPYGYNGLMLPEKYVDSPLRDKYAFTRIKKIEYTNIKAIDPDATSNDEDAVPLKEAYELLREAAHIEYAVNKVDIPTSNFKVTFKNLADTKEYADFKALEKVEPWDYVTVIADNLDIKSRMISYKYDAITQAYKEVELGNYVPSFSDTNTETNNKLSNINNDLNNINNDLNTVAESANGKNSNYYGSAEPSHPVDGDLWYKKNGDKTELWQYDGKSVPPGWKLVVDDATGEEVRQNVNNAMKEAGEAKKQANDAVNQANQAVADAGFANQQVIDVDKTANQAKADAAAAGQQAKDALTSAGTAITDAKKALADSGSAMADSTQARKDSAAAIKDAANSLTSAKDALNKVGSLTTSVTSQFTTVNNELKSKVNQTDYDKLKGTVTSQQTEINQNAAGIKLKADKTYADTINGNVNKNTGSINVLNNQIALTVSKTELTNTLKPYATQTWTQGQIKTTADQINLSVTKVQSNIDNLSSADRNLLLHSATWDKFGFWSQESIKPTYNADKSEITTTSVHGGPTVSKTDMSSLIPNDGDTVILSVEAKGTGTLTMNFKPNASDWIGEDRYVLTNTFKRYYYKFKWKNGANNSVVWYNSDSVAKPITLRRPKLVVSSVLNSDWSPAPEDYATEIQYSELKLTVNGIQSTVASKADKTQITQLADQIKLKADTTALNTVKGTVDKQGSEIALNTKNITLKANQSSVDTLKGTVDKQGSSISVNTNAIKLKADTSTVNTLTGRVSTAEGKINILNNEIALTVSKTELTNTLKPYATQTWTQGQIKTTADQINLSVTKVQTELNNTQVGGVNYLRNGNFEFGNANWRVWSPNTPPTGSTVEFQKAGSDWPQGTKGVVRIVRPVAHANNSYGIAQDSISVVQGCEYVVSFESATTIDMTFSVGDSGNGFPFQWFHVHALSHQRTQIVFKAPTGAKKCNVYFGFNGNDKGSLWISRIMMSQGNKSLDWGANPADYTSEVEFAALKVTVNSIQTTVSGKADKSQVTQLAGSITTAVQSIDKLNTEYTQVQQTIKGIQTTVGNKADKSQITQLANQITSTIDNIGTQNFVYNPSFKNLSLTGWLNTTNWYVSDLDVSGYNGTYGAGINLTNAGTAGTNSFMYMGSKHVSHSAVGQTFYFSAYVKIYGETTAGSYFFLDFATHNDENGSGRVEYRDSNQVTIANGTGKWLKLSGSFVPTKPHKYISLSLYFSAHGVSSAHVMFSRPMLSYVKDAPFSDQGVSASEITQLSNMINLRVQKGDVINQINISPESILIAGQKVHITGQTHIDNAVIKDAMIANVKADKITAGTINGANVNVINLNANNITTGTIKGANLSMNLNTGEVTFQKGRIHSASNNIDINIDQAYISTASMGTRATLRSGTLQLTEPTIFDGSSNPYLEISNDSIAGSSWNGASMIARDYLVLANRANMGGFFDETIDGPATFAGLAVGKSSYGGWVETQLGGANRGVKIIGGKAFKLGSIFSQSPTIRVGSMDAAKSDRISIEGSYVHIESAYLRTSSGSANVIVAADGALVRSTSASKYKTDIIRTNIPDYGEKLLELPTATWTDIAETKRYRDDPVNQIKPTRNFGMIAEDLADAGLEMLVVRGADGELEGINYDRIGPALIPVIAKLKNEVETLKQKLEEKTA